MSDPGHDVEAIDAARQQTIAVLDEISGKAASFGLPEPSPALVTARRKVLDDQYRVAVVGEAKRGKSTFVNALIGRPVLPTDVDIATSQVFLVRPAAQEACQIRFEDNSTREITAADLAKYGSQTVADQAGIPPLDQFIRWIEVDRPVRYSPPNISLLDTPGLGSLYAAHAQITRRFLPYADAVIFVLDSGQPISQPELDFVSTILEVTQNIFFIQTKIDLFRREQWQEIRARNEAILRKQLGERLPDVRVWPIASTLLLLAAQSDDDTILKVSGHAELLAALASFLFRVSGLSRSGQAVMIAAQYHAEARKTLAGRLAGVGEQSEQELAVLRQQAEETRRHFDEEWGGNGPKRRQLIAAIDRAGRDAKRRYAEALEQLVLAQQIKIDGLHSMDEAEKLAQDLRATVVAGAIDRWREIAVELRQQCIALLGPFVTDAEALGVIQNLAAADAAQRLHLPADLARNWTRQIAGRSNDDTQIVPGLLQEAIAVLVLVGMLAPPIATVGGAAAAIWAAARHFILKHGSRLHAAQDELREHLAAVTQEVRLVFLGPSQRGATTPGVIDEDLAALKQAVSHEVDAAAERKSREVRAELTRLADESQLAAQARQTRAAQLQQQLAGWDTLGQSLQSVALTLQQLDRSLASAARPAAATS